MRSLSWAGQSKEEEAPPDSSIEKAKMLQHGYLQHSRSKSAHVLTIQVTLLEGSEGFRRRESSQGLCLEPASDDFSGDAQHQPERSIFFKPWLHDEKAAALDKARAARAAAQGQAD